MNFFKDNYTTLNTFRILLVIFAIIAVTSPIITMIILKEEKDVLIMDAAGNFHLVVGRSFQSANVLHLRCVKAAVAALFTRTPDGFLYKDLLFQAFTGNCEKFLAKHIEDTKNEFDLKKIRQIPEIKQARILKQGNGKYLAHVLVYLTRACQFTDLKFVENLECMVTFIMIENPDISANGRFPLAVVKVERLELRKVEAKK